MNNKSFFQKLFKRELSIKFKITLWYSLFMVGLISLFLMTMFYISNNLVRNVAFEQLKETVNKSFSQINYEDENLVIDEDLEFLVNNIQLSIFDTSGELIYGFSPFYFDVDSQLTQNENIRIIKNKYHRWYSYEQKQYIEGYGDLWIKGVIESSYIENTLESIISISLIILPFFIIIFCVAGYFLSKKYFKPLDKIITTANEINAGNDLTKRINLGNKKDEFHFLANIFDTMFDRLQTSFENEVQFTSDVSHELRTPIAVIKTQSEYGLFTNDIDEKNNVFKTITKVTTKMSHMVQQLLMLSRSDRGHQKIFLEWFCLNEIIEIAIVTQNEYATLKNINIYFEANEEIFSIVDENLMVRVFVNLISNAITYGKENGFLKINLKKENENIIITVEDNGIGIEKENLHKIWQRFYQVDPSRTTDNSGLGLSLVKWIIEAHNGTIKVDSIFNKGTTFTINLPLKKENI